MKIKFIHECTKDLTYKINIARCLNCILHNIGDCSCRVINEPTEVCNKCQEIYNHVKILRDNKNKITNELIFNNDDDFNTDERINEMKECAKEINSLTKYLYKKQFFI